MNPFVLLSADHFSLDVRGRTVPTRYHAPQLAVQLGILDLISCLRLVRIVIALQGTQKYLQDL